jgi:hypothetical protein
MPFEDDLKFGNIYESLLLNYIPDDFDEIEMSPNDKKFKPWDLRVSKQNYVCKYEVKADRWTNKTGNFCIEYECFNQASGIATTEADVWAYFVVKSNTDQDCYLIPVKYIKSLIEEGSYKKMIGGDKQRSKFFLIPKSKFSSFLTAPR